MEPVRVKVYGLFSLTKRRYLTQAVAGLIGALLLLGGWLLGWPPLRDRLTQHELPAVMTVVVAVLNKTPWLLLGAGVWKGIEMYFVLRAFGRKEAKQSGERGASAP